VHTSALRIVVILAVLSILGITITQVYWVRKAFDIKQADFDRKVSTALFNVAQDFFVQQIIPTPVRNPVEQLSTNYYVIMLNSNIDPNVLELLIQNEFDKQAIKIDFEYGIYDCVADCMVYGQSISASKVKNLTTLPNIPLLAKSDYYVGIRFPDRESTIINQMGIWMFSSLVMLLVILFFAYALFVIFQQRKLSEIQNDFLNNMTHEFKTPLSTIALSAEVLMSHASQPAAERIIRYASIIDQETLRMRDHLERMLTVAKVSKKNIQYNIEVLSVHSILDETLLSMQPILEGHCVEIELLRESKNDLVRGDRHHLTNVLFNLIENAVKYSTSNLKISIASRNTGKYFIMNISDNGIGIAVDHQKKIFQQFYRVPTGNVHTVKGFGLGLSYVKQVLNSHKGTIVVQSQLHVGSTFTISLPTI
jgi:two-component system, OmpR family, phosphate regulon sensor histidine kinase PhoR